MTPLRYPATLRILHWLIAALILAALVMGTFVMARINASDPAKATALLKHILVGLIILSLTLLRLFIRPKSRRPPPMLSGIRAADRIVPFVHRIFDILVLTMVASGIGIAVIYNLPATIYTTLLGELSSFPTDYGQQPLYALHVLTARSLAAIVALHIVGAFYHQFILRDGLIGRMALVGGREKGQ